MHAENIRGPVSKGKRSVRGASHPRKPDLVFLATTSAVIPAATSQEALSHNRVHIAPTGIRASTAPSETRPVAAPLPFSLTAPFKNTAKTGSNFGTSHSPVSYFMARESD